MFDLINLYQGLIVFIQVGLASLNAILCCSLYRFCTKAVIKNKSEELKDETVYAVYQLSFMMIYIGVSLTLIGNTWGDYLTTNRDLFLTGSISFGVITREVIVFMKWVFGFLVTIVFGYHSYKVMKSNDTFTIRLKDTKKSDAMCEIIGIILIGLIAFL